MISLSIKSSISLLINSGISLAICYPEKSSSLEEGKKQEKNPEKIWWFQNNDVLLHPKSSIKSCPVVAHQPSFA